MSQPVPQLQSPKNARLTSVAPKHAQAATRPYSTCTTRIWIFSRCGVLRVEPALRAPRSICSFAYVMLQIVRRAAAGRGSSRYCSVPTFGECACWGLHPRGGCHYNSSASTWSIHIDSGSWTTAIVICFCTHRYLVCTSTEARVVSHQ